MKTEENKKSAAADAKKKELENEPEEATTERTDAKNDPKPPAVDLKSVLRCLRSSKNDVQQVSCPISLQIC